jgi:hypothetical protein
VKFGLPASSLLARTPTQTRLPGRKTRLLTLHSVSHALLSVRLCRAIDSFSRATPAAQLSRTADRDGGDRAGGAGSGSAPPPDAPSGPGTLQLGNVPAAPVDPPAGARASNPSAAPLADSLTPQAGAHKSSEATAPPVDSLAPLARAHANHQGVAPPAGTPLSPNLSLVAGVCSHSPAPGPDVHAALIDF